MMAAAVDLCAAAHCVPVYGESRYVTWSVEERGRVDQFSPPNHLCFAMAMVLKRLRAVCLALAFLVGLTAQLLPPSMPEAQMTLRADMTGGCDGPQPPCTGHMPNCVDHVGCVTVSALPASPISVAVAFEWASLDYDRAPESLSGISVKPELSPPILAT
jgi:hypothetical protein